MNNTSLLPINSRADNTLLIKNGDVCSNNSKIFLSFADVKPLECIILNILPMKQ